MNKKQAVLKVALLQYCATQDKAKNLAMAKAMAQEALDKNAKFILLPEVFNSRGDTSDKEVFLKAAEKIPGPSTEAFIPLAKKYKASILLGSIIEKAAPRTPNAPKKSNAQAYNTSVFIGPSGKITAKYRKINLFDARIGDKIVKESENFRAGRSLSTVRMGDFRVGLSICYDLRFSQLYQEYAQRGVEILTIPSCFTRKTGEAHWEVLLRARAIENLSYVVAPNQIGVDARGMQAYGNSMIISPWGDIIARGSLAAQEIIFGEIDINEVHKARQVLPGIVKTR